MAEDLSEKGRAYIAVVVVLTLLATVAVALRFLVRWRQLQKPGLDDWTILTALSLEYAMAVEAILWASAGKIGFPTKELTSDQITTFFKLFFANQITYSCISPTIKLGILLFYRRLFPTRRFYQVTLAVTILVIAWGIAVLCISIFQCQPLNGFWDSTIPHHCINGTTFFWGNSISNMLLDIIILCLPIRMVWNLQMSTARKVGLISVFLLGGFVCVASLMRIVSLGLIDEDNIVETLVNAAIWTTVEPCIGLVSACLPTLRPLFAQLWHAVSSRYNRPRILTPTAERKPMTDGSTTRTNSTAPNYQIWVPMHDRVRSLQLHDVESSPAKSAGKSTIEEKRSDESIQTMHFACESQQQSV